MTHLERIKFMQNKLKELQNSPDYYKKEIECLSWAIKVCKKEESRKRSIKEKFYR